MYFQTRFKDGTMGTLRSFTTDNFVAPYAKQVLAAGVAVFLAAACGPLGLNSRPVFKIENESLQIREGVSPGQVEREIRRAAELRNWRIRRLERGRLEATFQRPKKSYALVVEILYSTKKMSILYKDSLNLRYDGTNIHRTANNLALRLKTAIIDRISNLTAVATASPRNIGGRTPGSMESPSGSGFIVSGDGLVLTNDHVIKDCHRLSIRSKNFTTLARDIKNDLALLKGEISNSSDVAVFRSGYSVRLGTDVVVAGYPLQENLAGLNVTKGSVSRIDGTRLIQITAPVQPGNSGGPVLDKSGNVVGMVVSKLNALLMVRRTGSLPENVNFAISGGIIRAFLESWNVAYRTSASILNLGTEDIALKARKITVPIHCWN